MLRKMLSAAVAIVLVTAFSSAGAFAQKTDGPNAGGDRLRREEPAAARGDLRTAIRTESEKSSAPLVSNKSTLAEYERAKRQGKGLSTTTKVLIITGIAAAVLTIVVVAARNDLQNDILR